ncbi:potassium-transporting ATPase subunit C [Acrocarpospora catenulata]|uniref:potassium-transporting ATPase subunit C n=1 Tax=Acrocarpospora catenulata TaxID=2836182 RepID=UPI001BDAFEDC|nr:potassium-transporting ATPase subunit C [Acrocarpospora catenulata]
MERLPSWLRQHLAAIRAVVVLTVILGGLYPLAVTGVAQAVFHGKANGSLIEKDGRTVGSAIIGQNFTDAGGNAVARYFQSRPSAAGYDMLSTAASNLGPEDVIDSRDRQSLLTQVCARSKAIGEREGVSGARPYCTADGVGAVLKVFRDRVVSVNQACPAVPFVAAYEGKTVTCATPGEDYAAGRTVPVRGNTAAVVPADAVTAGGSGLDPHISVAYAELQAPRVARERGLDLARVRQLIGEHTTGRALGFMGAPAVNVLELNLALDGG